ncbi:hypothetical protein PR048_028600 [Dryococelus australis]|uniref:Uncharacterized protein n=1 Tax=Dryococelus australis TaxID=614101 RepID=A0ABQ9GDT8_9NEOP|nr:hypothetical protein PR048_028600 [Dryococelus australis]
MVVRAVMHYGTMKRRRHLQDTLNPFELRVVDFIRHLHSSRALAHDLCKQVSSFLQSQPSNHLPLHTHVLAAVKIFVTSSYQRSDGQDFALAVAQSSVSNCVRKISSLITENFAGH